MERMVVDTTRGQIEWSFQRPAGFTVLRRAVPPLGYPWEVAGAGDWEFPPSCPTSESEEQLFGGLPRVDLIPLEGVFVWLLMGDLRLDYEVMPRMGPPIIPDQVLAPSDEAPGYVAPFSDADRVESRFPNVACWDRLVFLINRDGGPEAEPLYLMLRAFAGPQRSSIETVNSLVSSLGYRHVA